MRTLRATLHNLGPFTDFTLDIDGAEGTVVAIKAPNGSGKTCALEMAWLGACYRDTATQGSLLERATDRDAFLESEIEAEDGNVYTVRHEVDSVAKKSESVVVRKGETEPLWKGTKVSAFDQWAERHLPPQDVLTSTVFAVQGANGFIGLGSAARISVILKAIGVARIERMAELARAGKKKTESELQTLGVRIGDVRDTLPDVEELTAKRDELEALVVDLAEQVAGKQHELDAAKATSADSVLAQQRYAELKRARDLLVAKVAAWRNDLRAYESDLAQCKPDELRTRLLELESKQRNAEQALGEATTLANDLRTKREAAQRRAEDRARVAGELARAAERAKVTATKIANNQYVIDHAEELRKALARAEELRTEIQRLEVEQIRLRGEIERHELATRQHDADRKRHRESAGEADRRVARATEALKSRPAVEEAVSKLEFKRTAAGEAEARVTAARSRLSGLRDTTIAGAEKRIDNLRTSLTEIRDNERPGHEQRTAGEAIDTDDRIVALANEHPRLVAEAQADIAMHEEALRQVLAGLRSIEALAAQMPVIHAAEEELAAATSELTRSQTAAAESEAMAQEEHRLATETSAEWKTATHTLEAHKAELVGLEPELKKAAALTGAEERIAEYQPQLEREQADEKRLADELAALPALPPVPADPDLPALQRAHDDAVHAARDANSALVRCEATKAQLAPQVVRHRGELAKLEQELVATPEPVLPGQIPQLAALEEVLQTVRDAYDEALRDYSSTDTRITQAGEQHQRIESLEQEARALELELADWTRLALDLGRDGIQSAEVDSAGPELTELTNDLLLTCHGPRYSVSIETMRTKANGKGATDECRVMVRDANDNSEREARLHSGGECVVLGEAVSLALTMMACRRSGVRGATLVRDESGAALDPQNARVYLDMLRHAAKVTHAPKVLFVSHSEDVQRMADSVLEIKGAA